MTFYNVIGTNQMQSGQPEDVSVVLNNFNAIAQVINGYLDDSNIVANAGLQFSKLAGYPGDSTKYARGDGVWSIVTAGLPIAGTVAAAASAFSSKLVGSDAQPAFQINGDGKHNWGPGGSTVTDTDLYRYAANQLQTDGNLRVGLGVIVPAGASSALLAQLTASTYFLRNFLLAADAQPAFDIRGDGKHEWGPGGSTAIDTNLYRYTTNILRTDSQLRSVIGFFVDVLSGNVAYQAVQSAAAYFLRNSILATDTQPAFQVMGDGRHQWGPGGSTALDTNLYRSAAGQLKTDSLLLSALQIYASQGAAGQVRIGDNAGAAAILFGSAGDANLYRSAAGVLRTDGALSVGAYGTSLPASPVDGQEYTLVDSTTTPTYTWRFRYNAGSSSSYKWEFVGGAPLTAQSGAFSPTGDSTWRSGVSVTMARAGEYQVQAGFFVQPTPAGATIYSGPGVNGGSAGAAAVQYQSVANANTTAQGFFLLVTVPAAGGVINGMYNATGACVASSGQASLTIIPKRVA